jgi:hypothetical protein
MINEDNKTMYDKINDFCNTFSEENKAIKKAIIEAFKIEFNNTKKTKPCKIVRGIYRVAKMLPQYNVDILASDLMMYCLDNNCTNCMGVKEEK